MGRAQQVCLWLLDVCSKAAGFGCHVQPLVICPADRVDHRYTTSSSRLAWSSRTAAALTWPGQGDGARLCSVDVLVTYSLYCSELR